MDKNRFEVSGMTCASCEAAVTRSVKKLSGIENATVNLLAGTLDVQYDSQSVSSDQIIKAVEDAGYGAALRKESATKVVSNTAVDHFAVDAEAMKERLWISIPFLAILMYFSMGSMFGAPLPDLMSGMQGAGAFALTQLLLTLPIVIANYHYFSRGLRALFKRNPNMDSLIAVGAGAALIYGIIALFRIIHGLGFDQDHLVHTYMHDLYFESAGTILTLISIGKYLELRSKSRTSDSIRRLMDLRPQTARVLRNGLEVEVPVAEVASGELLRIRPGEAIPVDGVIETGETSLDESALTGESIPVSKGPGDKVISATINGTGAITFRATEVGEDTTIAKIIALVEDANATKAPIQSLADKIAGIFVPIVILIAIATFVVWLLLGEPIEFALRLAITVLVISCPCALGLATPVAIMVGTGKGAENGVLIKSAEALEVLHKADTVVFDKTGTITEGKPFVTDIIAATDQAPLELLRLAASLEQYSEQPLASAILAAAQAQRLTLEQTSSFTGEPGMGVRATVMLDGQNRNLLGGNLRLMEKHGVSVSEWQLTADNLSKSGKTPMYFAMDGIILGLIAAADVVKNNSHEALQRLRAEGLRTVMLTGDNHRTAEAMAKRLEINEFYADVLPQDKDRIMNELQAQGHKVVMVGDGVNDAPALTRADVGIAIGAGTDVALESADVVLIRSDLMDVVTAFHLSRRTIRTVKQNLFWAFFYNVIFIPLAAGLLYPAFALTLNPMFAALAMSLSSVFVVLNALRLRSFRRDQASLNYVKTSSESQPIQMTTVRFDRVPRAIPPNGQETEPNIPVNNQTNKQIEEVKKMKKIIYVEGMTCINCQRHVEKALNSVAGVQAKVDWTKGEALAEFEANVSEEAVKLAVEDAGYSVSRIEAGE